MTPRRIVAMSALLAVAAGCANTNSIAPQSTGALPAAAIAARRSAIHAASPSNKIQHIVILVQDGRSFENLFAGWPGADAPTTGSSGGKKVPLHPVSFATTATRTDWNAARSDVDDGRMDGFPTNLYAYVTHTDIAAYRAMASNYVLADHMFPTELGGPVTSGIDLIAGTTLVEPNEYVVDLPQTNGCAALPGTTTNVIKNGKYLVNGGPFPCFNQFHTMADTLDAANVSWTSYDDNGSNDPWFSIANVPQTHISTFEANILADVTNGTLPSVSWVWPGTEYAPTWSARIIDAIGHSSAWDSTAIVVVWNDWGGWYDNASPPQKDAVGNGIRVPLLIVSPYSKRGYVSHTRYEFGSILKFVEETYDLPALGTAATGYSDTRAHSLVDSFDFGQAPRKFVSIPRS
jgi:phospholipase C